MGQRPYAARSISLIDTRQVASAKKYWVSSGGLTGRVISSHAGREGIPSRLSHTCQRVA